ncbi:uncharacterized protein [Ptychodera flava]|uniref:uncharacterized protein n=1 Tax=Ptychodera flava TaxID=63121 RepID=UPI00396A9463
MARLLILGVFVVLACASLAITESKAVAKSAMVEKLMAARRGKMAATKKDDDVSSLKALLQRKMAMAKKRGDVKTITTKSADSARFLKKKDGGNSEAQSLATGTEILDGILSNSKKRGLKFFPESKKSSSSAKKSYEEVFYAGEVVLGIVHAIEMAPCTQGVIAAMDYMMTEFDWDSVNWENLHENDFDTETLTFLEWWNDNQCSEFFIFAHTFYHYVWSVFWDDLQETPCFQGLPKDNPEGTSVDWTQAFEKVNSLDPQAWENYPEPQTACEVFEMVGELYFDFFFAEYFDAMPDDLIEDLFHDYGVTDTLDPLWGAYYLQDKYGDS